MPVRRGFVPQSSEITRSIVRPLDAAVDVARTVAAGDLTSTIHVTSKDKTGQLMQAVKDMNTSLQTMVGEVRSGSDTIASASSEIASQQQLQPRRVPVGAPGTPKAKARVMAPRVIAAAPAARAMPARAMIVARIGRFSA